MLSWEVINTFLCWDVDHEDVIIQSETFCRDKFDTQYRKSSYVLKEGNFQWL